MTVPNNDQLRGDVNEMKDKVSVLETKLTTLESTINIRDSWDDKMNSFSIYLLIKYYICLENGDFFVQNRQILVAVHFMFRTPRHSFF